MIPLLISAGMAGYQLYQAHQQKKEAEKMKPSNYVPPSVNEAVTSARMQNNATMGPATARGLQRLMRSSANSIEAQKRLGGSQNAIMQSVSDAETNEKAALKDLSVADAAFKVDNQRNLQGLLMQKGGMERMAYDDYNSAKSALIGASKQNTYNAISGFGEAAIYSMPDKALGLGSVAAGSGGAEGGAVNPNAAIPTSTTTTNAATSARRGLERLGPGELNYLRRLGILFGDYRNPASYQFNPNMFNSGVQKFN